MRPNTPHAVFTPSPSVVHGGHCYATSTLPDTLVGIVHSFVVGDIITNANHLSARFHLQEMIAFYHLALVERGLDVDGTFSFSLVLKNKADKTCMQDDRWCHVPDLKYREQYHQLMSICVFGILVNVLDFGTYLHPNCLDGLLKYEERQEMIKKDVNSLTHEERMVCIFTRGQALQIMEYVEKCYDMEEPSTKWSNLKSYHQSLIAHQCNMIFNYKRDAQGITNGAKNCDLELLGCQLRGVIQDPTLRAIILETLEADLETSADMMVLKLDAPLKQTSFSALKFGMNRSNGILPLRLNLSLTIS